MLPPPDPTALLLTTAPSWRTWTVNGLMPASSRDQGAGEAESGPARLRGGIAGDGRFPAAARSARTAGSCNIPDMVAPGIADDSAGARSVYCAAVGQSRAAALGARVAGVSSLPIVSVRQVVEATARRQHQDGLWEAQASAAVPSSEAPVCSRPDRCHLNRLPHRPIRTIAQ